MCAHVVVTMRAPTLRSLLAIGLLALGASVSACSADADAPETQEADHTLGKPTFAPYGWLWADETEEEFKQVVGETSMWSTPSYLPTDDPMTERLQFWIDRMDEALREAHPAALKHTPRPRVLVRNDDQINAWVSYIPVAWKVPTRIGEATEPTMADGGAPEEGDAGTEEGGAGGGASPGGSGARELVIAKSGQITTAFATPLEREHGTRQLQQFLKFHNEGFSKCRLALEDDTLVLGEECAVDGNVAARTSDRLAYLATGKWVTVTTGFIQAMLDEDRIVAVLAHELGHYYRAHSAQPTDVLNYFYNLGDGNHVHKPRPATRFNEMTAQVRDKLRSSSWWVDFSEENAVAGKERLGFYTTEQEADDIALEILTKIGMPPTLFADAMLALQRAVDDSPWSSSDTGELKWEECSMLRDKGFKDERGKWANVPVGDLRSAHHSYCFRVFNISREIAAHRYEVSPNRPRPPGESWGRLVTQLGASDDSR
jgi:Zn-dependent protease with chaperone function